MTNCSAHRRRSSYQTTNKRWLPLEEIKDQFVNQKAKDLASSINSRLLLLAIARVVSHNFYFPKSPSVHNISDSLVSKPFDEALISTPSINPLSPTFSHVLNLASFLHKTITEKSANSFQFEDFQPPDQRCITSIVLKLCFKLSDDLPYFPQIVQF